MSISKIFIRKFQESGSRGNKHKNFGSRITVYAFNLVVNSGGYGK